MILPPEVLAAIEEWRALPTPDESKPHFFVRYVSLDVATAGLRPGLDALQSLAAIGVHQGGIRGKDVCALDFAPVLSRDQIARHLAAFLLFLGKAPLVTFQAAFVDAFLKQAFVDHLGLEFSPHWIDLAKLLPEFFASEQSRRATLDDWLRQFSISLPGRREALPDALAVARLLLAVQTEAARRGIDTPRKLRDIESHRRWLGR